MESFFNKLYLTSTLFQFLNYELLNNLIIKKNKNNTKKNVDNNNLNNTNTFYN